jgi:hypothetical protein
MFLRFVLGRPDGTRPATCSPTGDPASPLFDEADGSPPAISVRTHQASFGSGRPNVNASRPSSTWTQLRSGEALRARGAAAECEQSAENDHAQRDQASDLLPFSLLD